MKRSKKKTRKNSNRFLILSLTLGLTACAAFEPKPTKFDGEWEFLKNERGETRACLPKEDVKKLREILIRCDRRGTHGQ